MTRRGLLSVLLVLSGAGSVEARHLPLVGDTVTVANRTQTLPEVFGSLRHTPNRTSGLTATRGIGQVRLGWEAADDTASGAGSTGRGWARRCGGAGRRWPAAGRRRPLIRWTACAPGPSTGSGCGRTRAGTGRPRTRRARRRTCFWPTPTMGECCFAGWTRPGPVWEGRASSSGGITAFGRARARGATGGRPAMRARGRTRCRG